MNSWSSLLLNGSDDSSRPNSRPNSRPSSTSVEVAIPRGDSRLSESPECRAEEQEEEERQTRVSFLPVFEAKTLSLSDGASSPVEARGGSLPQLDLSPGEDLTVS